MGVVWILHHHAGLPHVEAASRTYEMSRELVRLGHRVTVFASNFSHQNRRYAYLEPAEKVRIESHEGVRFVWIRTLSYQNDGVRRMLSYLEYAWKSLRIGRVLLEKPDAVVGYCVHPFAPLAAYLLAGKKKARFYYEVGDLWPRTLVDMGRLSERHLVTRLLSALEKFLFKRAYRIISLLPFVGEYVEELGLDPQKVEWIPNGIAIDKFKKVEAYDGGKGRPFVIMYLGSLGNRGMEHAIEALKLLRKHRGRKVRFVIYGMGPERERLEGLVEKWKLDNVEFRGLIPKNEIPLAMGEADAFYFSLLDLPLYRYGISCNKLAEYMISGRPVIFVSNARNNPIAESRAGITVDNPDPAAIADAIKSLAAASPEERFKMGRRGSAHARKYYDYRKLTRKLEQVLFEPQPATGERNS